MTIDVDPKDVVDEIRRLAKLHPDRNAKCFYLEEDGTPNCIVGHALINLGVPSEVLKERNHQAFNRLDERFRYTLSGSEEEKSVNWISGVQGLQDCGHSWGYAVEVEDVYYLGSSGDK